MALDESNGIIEVSSTKKKAQNNKYIYNKITTEHTHGRDTTESESTAAAAQQTATITRQKKNCTYSSKKKEEKYNKN